jgi:hypothetical protein
VRANSTKKRGEHGSYEMVINTKNLVSDRYCPNVVAAAAAAAIPEIIIIINIFLYFSGNIQITKKT